MAWDAEYEQQQRMLSMARECREIQALRDRGASWDDLYTLRFGTWAQRAAVWEKLEKGGRG